SLGLLAVGVVITTATLSPTVDADVEQGADITAGGNISVIAAEDATPAAAGGSPPTPIPNVGANASAEAPLTIGLLGAGNGAVPTANAQATVATDVAAGAAL